MQLELGRGVFSIDIIGIITGIPYAGILESKLPSCMPYIKDNQIFVIPRNPGYILNRQTQIALKIKTKLLET